MQRRLVHCPQVRPPSRPLLILAKTANKCHFPDDISNCTVGAKQPHFWYQLDHNNNPQGTYDPPYCMCLYFAMLISDNGEYGFMNGAQTDLFAGVPATAPSAAAETSEPSSSTVSTPSAVPDAGGDGAVPVSSPIAASAQSSSEVPASASAPSAAASAPVKVQCRRRKRAFERLDDSEVKRRHDIRAYRRSLRKRSTRTWTSREQTK